MIDAPVLQLYPIKLTCTAITEEAIMSNELDIVSLVTDLDAVDANGVPVGCIASVTAVEVVHRERRVG